MYVMCVISVYLQVQQSVLLDRQVSNVESFRFQNPTRVEDAFMFGLSGDDVILFGLVESGYTLQETERRATPS